MVGGRRSQIATETGVSKNTVHGILHRYVVRAFRVRPPVYTEEEEAEVIRRYVFEGEACEKIAPDMHMHHMTVIAIVRRHGYTVRPRGGARKKSLRRGLRAGSGHARAGPPGRRD